MDQIKKASANLTIEISNKYGLCVLVVAASHLMNMYLTYLVI